MGATRASAGSCSGNDLGVRFRGPLVASYPSAVLLVLLALCPYLVLATASLPLDPLIGRGAGVGKEGAAAHRRARQRLLLVRLRRGRAVRAEAPRAAAPRS